MPRSLAPAVLAALVLVSACAGPRALRLDRADLVGTTWREICPSPEIATAYVRLDPDGRMAWSYLHPDSVRAEDVHTWAVDGERLYLRWNNGSATSRYTAGPDPRQFEADTSSFCLAGPWIERVR